MTKNKLIRYTKADRVFYGCNYIMLTLFLIAVLYPLIYVLSSSFSSPEAIMRGQVKLLPVEFSLEGFKILLNYDMIKVGYLNSIFYTVVGTISTLVITIMAAYPLSKNELYGKKVISWFFIFTMFFSGGLITTYLLMKEINFINTRWVMIIPGILSTFNIMLMKTFFQTTIPKELHEAAMIDGYSDIQILTKIVIPLSKPIMAIIALYAAVAYWNTYFNALMYLNDSKLYPLQMVLRDILIVNKLDMNAFTDLAQIKQKEMLGEQLKYASIVVSIVPLLIIYPFMQKYLVQGMMIGSVKG